MRHNRFSLYSTALFILSCVVLFVLLLERKYHERNGDADEMDVMVVLGYCTQNPISILRCLIDVFLHVDSEFPVERRRSREIVGLFSI